MGGSDLEHLGLGVRRLELKDADVGGTEEVTKAFALSLLPSAETYFAKGKKARHLVLHSDLAADGRTLLCGLSNDQLVTLDAVTGVSTTPLSIADISPRIHRGLTALRWSEESVSVFFSSSSEDGLIQQWDLRANNKPAQTFAPQRTDGGTVGKKKGLLSLDQSAGGTVLAAGTELVKDKRTETEDSYVLLWDVRSTALLGGWWECHSDDVTAVRFHPRLPHALLSGSTDGLVNVFDLRQSAEDEALLYSFNTHSSVDKVTWRERPGGDAEFGHVACITHTNELLLWDTLEGDPVKTFSRPNIAEAMLRSNAEAVHLNACYSYGQTGFGLLAGSLTGDCARFLELNDSHDLERHSLFLGQLAVLQSAQFLQKDGVWVTFDETGCVKWWTEKKAENETQPRTHVGQTKRQQQRGAGRFEPYKKQS